MPIRLAATAPEIAAYFPVMAALRPHLQEADFVALIDRLARETGLRLAYLEEGGVQCVAGYRVSEWLAGGKYLEIEDLVSAPDARSRGYGGQMFDWLAAVARSEACDHLRLVSRVSRTQAHAFYERRGMVKEAYYFSLKL